MEFSFYSFSKSIFSDTPCLRPGAYCIDETSVSHVFHLLFFSGLAPKSRSTGREFQRQWNRPRKCTRYLQKTSGIDNFQALIWGIELERKWLLQYAGKIDDFFSISKKLPCLTAFRSCGRLLVKSSTIFTVTVLFIWFCV